MEDLVKRLKEHIVRRLLNVKKEELDKHLLTTSQGSFTRRELAQEIQEETEVGKKHMEDMLNLTIHLLIRKKENI